MESTTVLNSERIFELESVKRSGWTALMRRTVGYVSVILLMTNIPAAADECDFIAMVAQGDTEIADVEMEGEVNSYFQFLKNQSNADDNPDGYGLVYYNTDPFLEEGQKYYATREGELPVYYEYNDNGVMDQAIADITDSGNDAVIALGHDRLGSGGYGNHPFWLDWDGRTYSLVHNGVLTHGASNCLKDRLLFGLVQSGWFSDPDHASNWEGIPAYDSEDPDPYVNSWIDSELLFHYLMFFIIQGNGDVTNAIYTALNNTSFYGYNVRNQIESAASTINFVLSDGDGVYLFKNANDDDASHRMYYNRFPSGLVGGSTGDIQGDVALSQHQLVHIPVYGSIAYFDDMFLHTNGEFDVYSYHENYNWVCYPVLPTILGPFTTDFFDPLTQFIDEMQIMHETDDPAVWDGYYWTLGDISDIVSTKGYKVNIQEGDYDSYTHYVAGAELIDPTTELTLHAGVNYVPYFLEDSQHPSDAFPDEVLDRMLSIAAEDWFMVRINDKFHVKKDCQPPGAPDSVECLTLDYGKMYEVDMDAVITFTWNDPQGGISGFSPDQPEHFSYEADSDYIKVVIESIENGENAIEIGAIKDDVCVGAEVVNGYPINLRVYDESLSGVTYEIVTEEIVYRTIPDGPAPPPARRTLAPSSRRHVNGAVLMELADITTMTEAVPTTFSAVSAAPNPFNPSTNISFLLNRDAEVSLHIFNVRGKLVTTLLQGFLNSGLYSFTWNGTSDGGSAVASGIYYYQLSSPDQQVSNKLILIK